MRRSQGHELGPAAHLRIRAMGCPGTACWRRPHHHTPNRRRSPSAGAYPAPPSRWPCSPQRVAGHAQVGRVHVRAALQKVQPAHRVVHQLAHDQAAGPVGALATSSGSWARVCMPPAMWRSSSPIGSARQATPSWRTPGRCSYSRPHSWTRHARRSRPRPAFSPPGGWACTARRGCASPARWCTPALDGNAVALKAPRGSASSGQCSVGMPSIERMRPRSSLGSLTVLSSPLACLRCPNRIAPTAWRGHGRP